VLWRTVDAFRSCELVDELIVVCPADRFDACGLSSFTDPSALRVDGGSSRSRSVALGLAAVRPGAEFIAVHDGARPLVTARIITECCRAAAECGAASAARRVTETLKRSDADGFSRAAVDRDNLWVTETPQVFRAGILRRAYRQVELEQAAVTDEVSAVELLGIPSRLVQSRTPNPKITHPWDLELAATLLA
jgi:2-C-methyl-D-erythritol 4-phosphate cytidylyltransferase